MKATVNGVTYEGTEDEIRRIVENPPCRQGPIPFRVSPPPQRLSDPDWVQRNWDGSPRVTC